MESNFFKPRHMDFYFFRTGHGGIAPNRNCYPKTRTLLYFGQAVIKAMLTEILVNDTSQFISTTGKTAESKNSSTE